MGELLLYITDEAYEKLVRFCCTHDISKSDLINELILDCLDE